MLKATIYNKIFHFRALDSQKQEYSRLCITISTFPTLEKSLSAATTLTELLCLHRQAWGFGYQNENLSPCSHGMFRTKSIPEMQPSEVFLGGIFGLVTQNISFWEDNRAVTMAGNGFGLDESMTCYFLVMEQYRRLLSSNIRSIFKEAADRKNEYETYGYI